MLRGSLTRPTLKNEIRVIEAVRCPVIGTESFGSVLDGKIIRETAFFHTDITGLSHDLTMPVNSHDLMILQACRKLDHIKIHWSQVWTRLKCS